LKSAHIAAEPVRLASVPGAAAEAVGGGDHRVRAAGGGADDDRGTAVGADRGARPRSDHGADGGVGGEHRFDCADAAVEGRGAGPGAGGVDGDLERVGAGAAEFAPELFADADRIRAGRLPAGARERRLDPRRQHPETDRDQRPGEEDAAPVGGGEAPQPSDRSQMLARVQRLSLYLFTNLQLHNLTVVESTITR
jgi:hypothetical protein